MAQVNKWERQHRVPFVVYADFEAFLEPMDHCEKNPKKTFTVRYNKHSPSGFCYTIKCFDETVYPGKTVLYTMTEPCEDIGKKFVECLETDLTEVYEILDTDKPITMTTM